MIEIHLFCSVRKFTFAQKEIKLIPFATSTLKKKKKCWLLCALRTSSVLFKRNKYEIDTIEESWKLKQKMLIKHLIRSPYETNLIAIAWFAFRSNNTKLLTKSLEIYKIEKKIKAQNKRSWASLLEDFFILFFFWNYKRERERSKNKYEILVAIFSCY